MLTYGDVYLINNTMDNSHIYVILNLKFYLI